MNKIVSIFCVVLGVNLFGADNVYKGCGVDENQARLNLANNISTKIESTVFLEKKDTTFFGFDNFSKTVMSSSKQSSNLSLEEVVIFKQEKEVCATISKNKLRSLTQNLLAKIKTYTPKSLPEYEKEKVVKIKTILQEIKNAMVLVSIFKEKSFRENIEELEKKEKLFTNLRSKYSSQFAKITIVGNYKTLLMDNEEVKQNSEIFLKPGNHKYEIHSSKHCRIEGRFSLEEHHDFEKIINMNDFNLPYLIINSNKKYAKLTINGKSFPLGKKYIGKVCDDSNLPYTIEYENKKENNTFRLAPNETLVKNFTFYSQQEVKKFNTLAKEYIKRDRVEVKYGYMNVTHNAEYNDYENMNTLQLNYIKSFKSLRYGYGILYGKSSGGKSKAYELYYNAGYELSKFMNNNALHIKSLVVIPNISLQLGIGKHTLYNKNTDKTINKYDDLEKISWQNNGIGKLNIGADFVIHKNFAFNFFAQKQFTMEKSLTFGTGLIVSF